MESILLGLLAILVTTAFFFAKDFDGIPSKRKTFAKVVVAVLALGAITISSVFILEMFLVAEQEGICRPWYNSIMTEIVRYKIFRVADNRLVAFRDTLEMAQNLTKYLNDVDSKNSYDFVTDEAL